MEATLVVANIPACPRLKCCFVVPRIRFLKAKNAPPRNGAKNPCRSSTNSYAPRIRNSKISKGSNFSKKTHHVCCKNIRLIVCSFMLSNIVPVLFEMSFCPCLTLRPRSQCWIYWKIVVNDDNENRPRSSTNDNVKGPQVHGWFHVVSSKVDFLVARSIAVLFLMKDFLHLPRFDEETRAFLFPKRHDVVFFQSLLWRWPRRSPQAELLSEVCFLFIETMQVILTDGNISRKEMSIKKYDSLPETIFQFRITHFTKRFGMLTRLNCNYGRTLLLHFTLL